MGRRFCSNRLLNTAIEDVTTECQFIKNRIGTRGTTEWSPLSKEAQKSESEVRECKNKLYRLKTRRDAARHAMYPPFGYMPTKEVQTECKEAERAFEAFNDDKGNEAKQRAHEVKLQA